MNLPLYHMFWKEKLHQGKRFRLRKLPRPQRNRSRQRLREIFLAAFLKSQRKRKLPNCQSWCTSCAKSWQAGQYRCIEQNTERTRATGNSSPRATRGLSSLNAKAEKIKRKKSADCEILHKNWFFICFWELPSALFRKRPQVELLLTTPRDNSCFHATENSLNQELFDNIL